MKKLATPTMAALLGAAALSAQTLAAPAAQADDRPGGVRVGTLSCHEASGWGFVFGSSHRVRCIFSGNADRGRPERYVGSISKFGVDVGYQGSAVIVWAVFAPATHVGRGDLAGHYGGATANAAVGVGAGANVLIGGFHKSFTLQPVSITGETGLNVAAGIGELTLKPWHGD